MPMAGKGMLLTSMDIDAADEAEFNRWYDREHLEERVAIDGFLEARRYVAHDGKPKYLSLYSTDDIRGAGQPGLSHGARQPDRMVEGQYRALQEHDPRGRPHHHQPRRRPRCRARHHPPASAGGGKDKLRAALQDLLDPAKLDGIISMHLIESDPALSKPLTDDPAAANPGAGDWFVLIDATERACGPAGCGAHHRQRRLQAAGGHERRLSADVGSREERPAACADMQHRCVRRSAHAALPHNTSRH